MLDVSHKIDIGSNSFQSGDTSRLIDVATQASLHVPVNACHIVLETQDAPKMQYGDDVKVELGYADSPSRLFAGKVNSVSASVTALHIEALSTFSALTAARFNVVYEKQTAGDIVSDVLGRLEVTTGAVDPGVTFPTYILHDGRTIWEHLHNLAQGCDFLFYADEEDQAVFKAYAPQQTHEFQYGVHLLDYDWRSVTPTIEGVEVYGESPAGQGQSDDASSWLTKKEVKGSAGASSGHVLRLAYATARNQNLARSLATNLMNIYKVQARGRVRVLGEPAVQLGDAIKLAKMPVSSQDGTFRITAVRHRLNVRRGFITEIDWEKLA
jgi:hypothetical protein